MPLDSEKLLALKIPAVEHSYGPKDCMLYALGLGLGQDPLNADELAFVYEKNLKVLPTFAVMLGYSAYWLRDARARRHLEQGRARRSRASCCTAGRAARHGDRAHPDRGCGGQGRGQGRADLFRARDQRQGERRPAGDLDADDVLPRRRRLWRAQARDRRDCRRTRCRSARPISSATCRPGRKWR